MAESSNVSPITGKPQKDKSAFINAGLLEPKPSEAKKAPINVFQA